MTNVEEDCVFSSNDVKNKYFLPQYFYQNKLDEKILRKLQLFDKHQEINFDQWLELPQRLEMISK